MRTDLLYGTHSLLIAQSPDPGLRSLGFQSGEYVTTDWELPNRLEAYEIDPGTLCRGTGLKDKNGLPLWEHDLVKVDGIESLAEIRYGEYKHISAQREYPNGDYGFYLFWKDEMARSVYRNDILYFLDKCHIVGT